VKIVVSSNCQTGGLAGALLQLFPAAHVVAIPQPGSTDAAGKAKLSKALQDSDVWITNDAMRLQDDPVGIPLDLQVVQIVDVVFDAFHPDLCYARKKSTGELTTIPYNSAIVAWCYAHGVEPADVEPLFSRTTYQLLGYFNRWSLSVADLRSRFDIAGLTSDEFTRFFRSIKRTGSFMHTNNHPKVHVVVELARLAAARLGVAGASLEREIVVNDGLSGSRWPVYPEIADEFALATGSTCWHFNDQPILTSIRGYVDFAYSSYRSAGIDPADLDLWLDTTRLDQVLPSQLRQ
jgi:hypothetical protein